MRAGEIWKGVQTMRVGELCNREVIVVERGASVREAASLLREYHVGDLVVTDERGGQRVPVGIVTDRDITIEVVAKGVDPESVTVGEVMGPELVAAGEAESAYDIIQRMRSRGIRRLPVVDARGGLIGIVSVVDLLEFVSEQITMLAKVGSREQDLESVRRK
jgi:CBS domain-containing protein